MSPDQPVNLEQPPPAPAIATRVPRRRRSPLLPVALALAGLAAVGALVVWWLDARGFESTDDAFIDTHMARVAPQVAGRVAMVAVDDNQAVVAGQLLIKIDPANFRARLDQ